MIYGCYEKPIIIVENGTGEMKRRYGFIYVDKNDGKVGTYT